MSLQNLGPLRAKEVRTELVQLESEVNDARREFDAACFTLRERRDDAVVLPCNPSGVKYFSELFRLSVLYQSLGKNYFQNIPGEGGKSAEV